MPLVDDEMQASVRRRWWSEVGHRYGVELAVGSVVLITIAVTTPDLFNSPLAALSGAVRDITLLVAALLLADHVLRSARRSKPLSPTIHHGLTILIGGTLSELVDWLLGFREPFASMDAVRLLSELAEACAYAATFWIVCLAVRSFLARAVPGETANALPAVGIMGALPQQHRQSIEWMKAEGNYVSVHSQGKQHLVKYVFSRAVEELGSMGLQVHRSYWIATSAVQGLERTDGKTFVILEGGERVPVSRSYMREVRQTLEHAQG